MAVYGVNFYGVGHFGMDPATVRPDFSVAPFTSTPFDYSTLHLSWNNPPSSDCAYLRLVRNPRNLPQDENDGVQVFDVSDFIDTVPDAPSNVFGEANDSIVTGTVRHFSDLYLPSGFHYYSMFGWSTSSGKWIRCTDLIAMVPINWGYGGRLYDLLPMAYRDQDVLLVDPYNPWPVDGANPPLQRFLQLIGFQFDFLRTELESLMSINDAMNCSGALLPLMMQQFGLVHEPEMGMQQERQLVQNAIHLYKQKGSPRGITEFASILTSYPATQLVHHGYNCLLVRDDGVMATSIGTWQVWPPKIPSDPAAWNSNPAGYTGTYTNVFATLAGQAAGIALTPIATLPGNPLTPFGTPSTFPTLQPTYSNSGMRVQGTGAGDYNIVTSGMPITDFMSQTYGTGHITWRVQIYSPVSRTVYLSVWGDNGTGTRVQVLPEQSFTGITINTWTTLTTTGTLTPYPSTTPGSPVPQGAASYYRLYPQVRIAGAAANEAHHITLCGLWPCTPAQIGVDTLPYEYPRDIKILMQPTSSNLLPNTLTSFIRPNPTPPPTNLSIGFDGLNCTLDPKLTYQNNPGVANYNPYTCALIYRPASLEDPPALVPVHGNAALEVDTTGPGATVWFGRPNGWSAVPPTPYGWFSTLGNWFPGAQRGPLPRPWFDPVLSWFVVNQNWFGVGSDWINGLWFARPQQPTLSTTPLLPFNVNAGQPFNFSVYAQYTTVQDPSNAYMLLGFRWYYPDGTWAEVTNTQGGVPITAEYQRYSVAPENGPFYLSDPPLEPVTGVLPITMYPFVRFPTAQLARFLLNSAMLAPQEEMPEQYMDAASQSQTTGDFVLDPNTNASYAYPHRTPRIARLNAEMYRWVPMGSTYSITYASAAVTPPLDPTLWP